MELDGKINALEAPYSPDRQPLPTRWEPEQVARARVKAFATLDRMPRSRGPREPGGHWPRHSVEWADQLAQAEIEDSERRARDAASNRTNLRPTSLEIAQMDAAFDWLRELRAADKKIVLSAVGLPEALANMRDYNEERAKVSKDITPLSDADNEAGRKQAESLDALMRKFDNFETHLGASLAVPLTEVQEQISKFIDADGAKVTQFFGDLATEISKTDWKAFGAEIGAVAGDVKTAAEYIDDIVKKTVGWRVASDALIGVALAGWLLPVGVALGGIALALGKIAGVGGIPGALALGGAFEFGK